MEEKKKTGTEPKLTVLVRRKREEGILNACKGIAQYGPDGGEWCVCSGPECETTECGAVRFS